MNGYARGHWGDAVWAVVCGIAAAALAMVPPALSGDLVEKVLLARSLGPLWWIVGASLAAAALRGVTLFFRAYLSERFGQITQRRLRNDLYHHLIRLSFPDFDRMPSGQLMSRVTSDTEWVQRFYANIFTQGTSTLFTILFVFTAVILTDQRLGWILLGLFPILAFLSIRFHRQARPTYHAVRRTYAAMATHLQETVSGIRVVKSFAQESRERAGFGQQNEDYRQANLSSIALWSRYYPLMDLAGGLYGAVTLLIGGLQVIHHQIDVGALVAVSGYVLLMVQPLRSLGPNLNLLVQANTAGSRLYELMTHTPSVPEPGGPDDGAAVDGSGPPGGGAGTEGSRDGSDGREGPAGELAALSLTSRAVRPDPPTLVHRGRVRGRITFDHATLRYEGTGPAVVDLTVDVPAGGSLAVVGATGSGKSSVLALPARFYDVSGGRVCVDGVDVRQWDLGDLRSGIGYVMQESFLFSASVAENIAFGRPEADRTAIEEAARVTEADGFIRGLPEGYETIVGERGIGLSGGQRQRLALARAYLIDPPILVLDDAWASVDLETEQAVQGAMADWVRRRTVLIVAHRLSTIRGADRILYLDQGRILALGTHEELLRTCPPYWAMLQHQEAEETQGTREGDVSPVRVGSRPADVLREENRP